MQRQFDGLVCIGGEDWWYHNRGHFDFQVMRRLARRFPVLFVNSVGVRLPSIGHGHQFLAKIGRKLRSLNRGLVEAEPGFHVLSPLAIPGSVGQFASGWALARQIRSAARRIGIERPLLWVHCPAGAGLLDLIESEAVVLQRTDRFESFPEGDPRLLGAQIAELKARADLVVYCNGDLQAEEAGEVAASVLVTHGVDFERFASAGSGWGETPADMAGIRRPRVGFIGGIDAHTFDPGLFAAVAAQLPEVTFALIGGCSLPAGWCPHANVHLLGRKPYDQVADYMAACDVLIMPWNRSPWIAACNPIKLKEYLATGRPVVTTDFPALAPYRDLVRVAGDAGSFAAAISKALGAPHDAAAQRLRVADQSWEAKTGEIIAALGHVGLEQTRGRSATIAA